MISPLARHLEGVLRASRTKRVVVEELRRAAQEADSSLLGDPDARARLRAAIEELVEAGSARVPPERRWDPFPRPALPPWVQRVDEPGPAPAPATRDVVWHAALWWVPEFLATQRPTPRERELLLGVHRFLADGGSEHVVPVRERSLQLTGDEKALDHLVRGRLFDTGRLDLGLLRMRVVGPRVESTPIGEGPVVLIVENYATYHSLAATLPPDGTVGRVVYGAGNQLNAVLVTLASGPDRPDALAYFGDLDGRGLEIARSGAALASDLGLPELRPATMLYGELLRTGRPGKAGGRGSTRGVEWLPSELRDPVVRLFEDGCRLAQEAVGLDVLAGLDLRHPTE